MLILPPLRRFYLNIILISCSFAFDSDIDICENFNLDSAVFADDNNTYIFKGKYFWKTRNLNEKHGIDGYANNLTVKWSALTEPVIASFTVPDNNANLMTVFILNNKWISYQNNQLKQTGSTAEWPLFPNGKVSTAFTANYGHNSVYFLYNNCRNYVLYNLKDILKPVVVRVGTTTVNGNYVWFLEEKTTFGGFSVLTDILDVNVAITYENLYLFVSKTHYCFVNLKQQNFTKECVPVSYQKSNLFNCPLKESQIPITNTGGTSNTTDNAITEPIIDGNNKKESNSESSLPLIITAIVIAIIVGFILIGGAIGYIIKRRKTSRNKSNEVQSTYESTTSSVATVKTIDSRGGGSTYSKQIK